MPASSRQSRDGRRRAMCLSATMPPRLEPEPESEPAPSGRAPIRYPEAVVHYLEIVSRAMPAGTPLCDRAAQVSGNGFVPVTVTAMPAGLSFGIVTAAARLIPGPSDGVRVIGRLIVTRLASTRVPVIFA